MIDNTKKGLVGDNPMSACFEYFKKFKPETVIFAARFAGNKMIASG